MKAICTLLFSFVLSVAWGTDVPAGNVSGTWTSAGNPYLVQGDIRVVEGESLILGPGVEVQFSGNSRLHILGNFIAEGTETDSVRLKAQIESTGWKGIELDSLAASSDSTRFEYTVISEMKNTSIRVINTSKVVFEHCSIRDNWALYIGALYTALGSPRLYRTHFSNNVSNSGSEGAAMYIWDASPVLTQCVFENNYSPWTAGAIAVYRSDIPTEPVFDRCVFRGNSTGGSGGAIVLHSNTPSTFIQCVFEDNHASYNGGAIWDGYTQANFHQYDGCSFINNWCEDDGGAVYMVNTKVNMEDCLFEGNYTMYGQGGALHAYDENLILGLTGCRFLGNTANSLGGGIYVNDYATLNIDRCAFIGNQGTQGGGMSVQAHTEVVIQNSIIANNSTSSWGGGAYFTSHTHPKIDQCVFAGNEAGGKGGAFSLGTECDPVIHNSIFWGNVSEDGVSTYAVNEYIWHYCDPSFYNCIVEEGEASFIYTTSSLVAYEACLETDPNFTLAPVAPGIAGDWASGQWSVLDASPALENGTGDLETLALAGLDYIGQPRLQGASLDIGAYEGAYDWYNELGDLDGDGIVGTSDLLLIIGSFGCQGPGCSYDLNGDGNTGAADILFFLGIFS